MPYVRQQPGQKPGDQQREQVEQTSGLQRESGLIGSTGGSLHEGRARPQAPAAPTLQQKKPVSRAVNLSDYAAANIDKTRALAQQTAANVAGGARRAQSRLGQAQQEFRGLATQGPSLGEGLAETRRIQQKALDITGGDVKQPPSRTILADSQRQSDAFGAGQRFLKSQPPTTPTRQTNLTQGPENLPQVETKQVEPVPGQPIQGGLTEEDIRRYQELTGGYKGPQALGEVDTSLSALLGATSQEGQLAATTEGQRGLLAQQVGDQAGYTAGAGALDASLIAGQAGGIQQAGRAAQAVGQRGLQAAESAGQLAQQRTGELSQIQQEARQQLQQQVLGREHEVTQQVEAQQEQAKAKQASFNKFIESVPEFGKVQESVAGAKQKFIAALKNFKKGRFRSLVPAMKEFTQQLSNARQLTQNYVASLDPNQLAQFGLTTADFRDMVPDAEQELTRITRDPSPLGRVGRYGIFGGTLFDRDKSGRSLLQEPTMSGREALTAEDLQAKAFLGPGADAITAEGVMTEQQRRQLQALQRLASVSGGRIETKI